jgi:predicted HNH restriction endonuclease
LELLKCNRGQICDVNTIEHKHGADYSLFRKQKFLWNLIPVANKQVLQTILSTEADLNDYPLDEFEVTEGQERTLLKLHKYKERDARVITAAKKVAKANNKFFCVVCHFNFEDDTPV